MTFLYVVIVVVCERQRETWIQ